MTTEATPAALRLSEGLGPRWWDCATHGRAQENAWGCPECVKELREENRLLRQLLAVQVGGTKLYVDDGELQDNSVVPCIDFRRATAANIQYALQERGRRKMEDDAYWGAR